MYTAKKKARGVEYLNHFPKYFIRPYGKAEETISKQKVIKCISQKNCEWLVRPKIQVSETAETVTSNFATIQDHRNILDKEFSQKLEKRMDKFVKSCKNLNSKSDADVTEEDISTFISFVKRQKNADVFQELYRLGHAMVVMSTHILVTSHLFKDAKVFAEKSVNVESKDRVFKKKPNDENLARYLKKCILGAEKSSKTTRSNLPSQKRSVLSLLDSQDSLESPPQTNQRTPAAVQISPPVQTSSNESTCSSSSGSESTESSESEDSSSEPYTKRPKRQLPMVEESSWEDSSSQ